MEVGNKSSSGILTVDVDTKKVQDNRFMKLEADPLVVRYDLGTLTVRFLRPGDDDLIPKMLKLVKHNRDRDTARNFLGRNTYDPKVDWCQMKPSSQIFHTVALWTSVYSNEQTIAGVCTFTSIKKTGTIAQIKKNLTLDRSIKIGSSLLDFVEARLWEISTIDKIYINTDSDNTNCQRLADRRNYLPDEARREVHKKKYPKEVCFTLFKNGPPTDFNKPKISDSNIKPKKRRKLH